MVAVATSDTSAVSMSVAMVAMSDTATISPIPRRFWHGHWYTYGVGYVLDLVGRVRRIRVELQLSAGAPASVRAICDLPPAPRAGVLSFGGKS